MKNGMPNFAAVAEAYGIKGYRVNTLNELEKIINEHLNTNESFLVDVNVVENENCYPMVAPGRSNSQMLGLENQ
jgi:acetolactate synthase-1/2/3 large subunit